MVRAASSSSVPSSPLLPSPFLPSYSVLIWEIVHAKTPDLLAQEGDVSGGPLLSRLQRQLDRGARLKMGADLPEWARHVFAEGSRAAPHARPSFVVIVARLEAVAEQ